MANGVTYGINFPFRESFNGRYLDLSDSGDDVIVGVFVALGRGKSCAVVVINRSSC